MSLKNAKAKPVKDLVIDRTQPSWEITLSDGSTATISKPLGKHLQKGQIMADGDQSTLAACMMCQLVKINGNPQTIEFFGELPVKDYVALTMEVMGEGK